MFSMGTYICKLGLLCQFNTAVLQDMHHWQQNLSKALDDSGK